MKNYIEKKILEVAIKLFEENGFAQTDMKTIAKEADIAVGTIYNYFESKQALFEKIIVDSWERSIEKLQEISNSEQDSEVKVHKFILEIYERIEKHKTLIFEAHNSDMPRHGKPKQIIEKLKIVKKIFVETLGNREDGYRTAETIVAVIPRLIHNRGEEKRENLEFLYKIAKM